MNTCYIAPHFADGIRVTPIDPEISSANELANTSYITCKIIGNEIKIEDAYVEIQKREQGLFKMMIVELELWAKNNNFQKIWGIVCGHPNGPNEVTLKLIYKKLDFNVCGSKIEKTL